MTPRLRRPRPSERGFALALAVIVAVLYFALIELLMIDASRDLAQARQFRSYVIAQTLAENAAELAALKIVDPTTAPQGNVKEEDWQGTMVGTLRKTTDDPPDPNDLNAVQKLNFVLTGQGETAGLAKARAAVEVTGRIEGNKVLIDFTKHAPQKTR
jgi:Tfp pilus assembly protein PilX